MTNYPYHAVYCMPNSPRIILSLQDGIIYRPYVPVVTPVIPASNIFGS